MINFKTFFLRKCGCNVAKFSYKIMFYLQVVRDKVKKFAQLAASGIRTE